MLDGYFNDSTSLDTSLGFASIDEMQAPKNVNSVVISANIDMDETRLDLPLICIKKIKKQHNPPTHPVVNYLNP